MIYNPHCTALRISLTRYMTPVASKHVPIHLVCTTVLSYRGLESCQIFILQNYLKKTSFNFSKLPAVTYTRKPVFLAALSGILSSPLCVSTSFEILFMYHSHQPSTTLIASSCEEVQLLSRSWLLSSVAGNKIISFSATIAEK